MFKFWLSLSIWLFFHYNIHIKYKRKNRLVALLYCFWSFYKFLVILWLIFYLRWKHVFGMIFSTTVGQVINLLIYYYFYILLKSANLFDNFLYKCELKRTLSSSLKNTYKWNLQNLLFFFSIFFIKSVDALYKNQFNEINIVSTIKQL